MDGVAGGGVNRRWRLTGSQVVVLVLPPFFLSSSLLAPFHMSLLSL